MTALVLGIVVVGDQGAGDLLMGVTLLVTGAWAKVSERAT